MDDCFKNDFRSEVNAQLMSKSFKFLTKARGPAHGRSGRKQKSFFLGGVGVIAGSLSHIKGRSMDLWILVCGRGGRYLIDAPLSQERNGVKNVCSKRPARSVKPARPRAPPGAKHSSCFHSRCLVAFVLLCFPSVIKEVRKMLKL